MNPVESNSARGSRVLKQQLRQQLLASAQCYGPLTLPKVELLEFAFGRFHLASFADLGPAYRVDGGYSFYVVDHWPVKRAVLVDTHPTQRMIEQAAARKGVEIVRGNFGDPKSVEQVGEVEAVVFFDVLLHQVTPNWDELLRSYAARTRFFVIHNPQWLGPTTVRLLDLGAERFLEVVPKERNEETYRAAIERPDEINPVHQRANRDVHHIWQWGITDNDLIALMNSLGFSLRYFEDSGHFWGLKDFRNHSFIFERNK